MKTAHVILLTVQMIKARNVRVVCRPVIVDGWCPGKFVQIAVDFPGDISVEIPSHHVIGIGESVGKMRGARVQEQARRLGRSAADGEKNEARTSSTFRVSVSIRETLFTLP